jgi:hypothetical protein
VRNKVVQANCDVVCFQETKRTTFDNSFIRNVLPPCFDDFLFVPSAGASGGLLVAWRSAILMENLKFTLGFAIAVEFSTRYSNSSWNLMNVYGPCTPEGKRDFANWLKNIDLQHDEEWIILGDFNLYRFPENRIREGVDLSDMNLFNNVISHLGLIDITLQGKRFTWSNLQNPLCWKSLIGFSLTLVGLLLFVKLLARLLSWMSLITVIS